MLPEPLDRATLAGRVTPLEHEHQLVAGVLDPVLGLQQLDLQTPLVLLVLVAAHPLGVRVVLLPRHHGKAIGPEQHRIVDLVEGSLDREAPFGDLGRRHRAEFLDHTIDVGGVEMVDAGSVGAVHAGNLAAGAHEHALQRVVVLDAVAGAHARPPRAASFDIFTGTCGLALDALGEAAQQAAAADEVHAADEEVLRQLRRRLRQAADRPRR